MIIDPILNSQIGRLKKMLVLENIFKLLIARLALLGIVASQQASGHFGRNQERENAIIEHSDYDNFEDFNENLVFMSRRLGSMSMPIFPKPVAPVVKPVLPTVQAPGSAPTYYYPVKQVRARRTSVTENSSVEHSGYDEFDAFNENLFMSRKLGSMSMPTYPKPVAPPTYYPPVATPVAPTVAYPVATPVVPPAVNPVTAPVTV